MSRIMDNREIAHRLLNSALRDPAGGSIDLHVDNRGGYFRPEFDVYIVGGAAPVVMMQPHIMAGINRGDPAYTSAVYENIIVKLFGLIEQADSVGAEIVGWWRDAITGTVYFDASDIYRTDFYDTKHVTRIAMERGELAVATYNSATDSTAAWRINPETGE